jgi:integrase
MTAKNRERLRQFDVPANLDALLALPDRAFCETEKGGAAGPQEALHMMLAVAVELLTVTTLRMKNLAALDIDRHLIKVRRNGQVEYRIVIPAAEMKTDAPFEMTVPQMSLPLLAAYLNTHRRRLATDPGPHLFPGRKGARSPSALGRAISAFIKRETGLTMHPHLFRALGTRIHLERRPHAIEEMRRVLGHRSSATTIEAYTDFSTAQAFREYDETIARRRRDGDSRRAPTARKKPRK